MLDIQSSGNDTTVVRVIGECDYGNRETLRSVLATVAETGVSRVILSFEACDYIDSSVVSTLLQYRKKLRDRFVLVVPEDRSAIHRILEVLSLHATLDVQPSL